MYDFLITAFVAGFIFVLIAAVVADDKQKMARNQACFRQGLVAVSNGYGYTCVNPKSLVPY